MSDTPTWTTPQPPDIAPDLPYADHWFWISSQSGQASAAWAYTLQTTTLAGLAGEIGQLQSDLEATYFDDQSKQAGATE